jgi:hypothetical protein
MYASENCDAVYGCLIGGAIGDALGAPVEGWNYWEVREKYGRLAELIASPRANANQKPGGVTDDTALRQYSREESRSSLLGPIAPARCVESSRPFWARRNSLPSSALGGTRWLHQAWN